MKRRLAPLVLAVALLAAGCGGRPATEPAGRPVVILLDLSGSTEAVAPLYKRYVGQVVDSLEGGEHLLVVPISGASLTAAAAVELRFPAYHRFTTNSFAHGRAMKKLRQEALDGVDKLLASPRTAAAQRTAIIDGLLQTGDLIAGRPGATICIISDMVEDSDLARFESLTEAAIPAVLEKVEAGGRLPRFPGETGVHVAGLGAAGQMEPARILAVRRFWEQFFARAGATLVEYGPEFHAL